MNDLYFNGTFDNVSFSTSGKLVQTCNKPIKASLKPNNIVSNSISFDDSFFLSESFSLTAITNQNGIKSEENIIEPCSPENNQILISNKTPHIKENLLNPLKNQSFNQLNIAITKSSPTTLKHKDISINSINSNNLNATPKRANNINLKNSSKVAIIQQSNDINEVEPQQLNNINSKNVSKVVIIKKSNEINEVKPQQLNNIDLKNVPKDAIIQQSYKINQVKPQQLQKIDSKNVSKVAIIQQSNKINEIKPQQINNINSKNIPKVAIIRQSHEINQIKQQQLNNNDSKNVSKVAIIQQSNKINEVKPQQLNNINSKNVSKVALIQQSHEINQVKLQQLNNIDLKKVPKVANIQKSIKINEVKTQQLNNINSKNVPKVAIIQQTHEINQIKPQQLNNIDLKNVSTVAIIQQSDVIIQESNEVKPQQLAIDNLNAMSNLSFWGLPESILIKYKSRKITQMFAWQIECLSIPNVLENNKNLVYSAPTSAGKTLVAEILAIKTVIERKKKVLFILPFVSVVREKMFYFQDILGSSGIRVEGFMGSYNPPGGFQSVQVAICTIEKANSLINRLLEEGALADIGALIVDELHLLGDPSRGYLLELLLTKVRYMSLMDEEIRIQIIGMSATLPNLELLAKWLGAELYMTQFRPIPLFEQYLINGEIFNNESKLQRKLQRIPELDKDVDNILQLCLETMFHKCAVLIFCPTKNWCENLAQQISLAFHKLCRTDTDLGLKLRAQLSIELIGELLEQLKRCPSGLDAVLKNTASVGVAFHHAGLTMDERDIIEGGFRTGSLRVLVATSTLSSGVNLPARRVIIRSPMFFGKPMDTLTYRQMIGRAGRMGKDVEGESILICQKSDFQIAQTLISAHLKPIESCLQFSGKLKRAILEVVASGVATTPNQIKLFTNCTLLANDEIAMQELDNPIKESITFLTNNELIRLQTLANGDAQFVATPLAKACLSSSMPPEEGLALFAELEKARQCFVLETELHLIYLVTPYSACNQLGNIDWLLYLSLWEKLPASMKRVGELIGISLAYIINASRGQLQSNTNKLLHKLQIHKRFYTALALQDLVNEIPLANVANKFNCNRGMLQALQQSAATFAAMVTSFSKQLGWSSVELLIAQFQDRLQFGIARELLDLMRLPVLNGQRARAIFNGGFENLIDLAVADVCKLENILHTVVPFESEKEREGESDFAAKQRNKVRTIWVTGKQGLTEREASVMIIEDARKYLQFEMGLKDAKWDTIDADATIGKLEGMIQNKASEEELGIAIASTNSDNNNSFIKTSSIVSALTNKGDVASKKKLITIPIASATYLQTSQSSIDISSNLLDIPIATPTTLQNNQSSINVYSILSGLTNKADVASKKELESIPIASSTNSQTNQSSSNNSSNFSGMSIASSTISQNDQSSISISSILSGLTNKDEVTSRAKSSIAIASTNSQTNKSSINVSSILSGLTNEADVASKKELEKIPIASSTNLQTNQSSIDISLNLSSLTNDDSFKTPKKPIKLNESLNESPASINSNSNSRYNLRSRNNSLNSSNNSANISLNNSQIELEGIPKASSTNSINDDFSVNISSILSGLTNKDDVASKEELVSIPTSSQATSSQTSQSSIDLSLNLSGLTNDDSFKTPKKAIKLNESLNESPVSINSNSNSPYNLRSRNNSLNNSANSSLNNSQNSLNLSVKTSLSNSAKTSLNHYTKTSLNNVSKTSLNNVAKTSLNNGAKASLNNGAKASLHNGERISLSNSAQASLRNGIKTSLNNVAKTSLNNVAKTSLNNGAKASLHSGEKISLGNSAQASLRNGAKTSTHNGEKISLGNCAKTSLENGAKTSLNNSLNQNVNNEQIIINTSSQSLFDDSLGLDSNILNNLSELESKHCNKNKNESFKFSLETDSILEKAFMSSFEIGDCCNSKKNKSATDNSIKKSQDRIIDISEDNSQDKIIKITEDNSQDMLMEISDDNIKESPQNVTNNKRNRIDDSQEDLFLDQTPNKKSKFSIKPRSQRLNSNIDTTYIISQNKIIPSNSINSKFNDSETSVDFTHVDIINLCGNKKVFEQFSQEIMQLNEISIAIACERIEECKQIIGNRIIKKDLFNEHKFDYVCKNRRVSGLSISWGGNVAYYMDFDSNGVVKNSEKIKLLKRLLDNEELKVRMFDCKEQIKVLKQCCDIDFNCECLDPKIADWIMEPEGKEKNLQAMTSKYAPEVISLCQLGGHCKGSGSISLELQSTIKAKIRGCVEAVTCWHLIDDMKDVLCQQDVKLIQTFAIEMSCVVILSQLELYGFGIDLKALQSFADDLKTYTTAIEKKAFQLVGRKFSFTSSTDVAKVLGMHKGKQRVSTNKQVLEQSEKPISKLILLWRKLNSTLTKMVYPLLRMVENGRIYGSCITHNSTGRVAMHEPNLQNVPNDFEFIDPLTNDKINISCRKAFVAKNKNLIVSADYCQLELRLLAHLSQDNLLCNIMQANNDVFTSIAAKWNHTSESKVSAAMRQQTKQLCYGIIYGMGSKTLSEQLDVPEDDAKEFTETFHRTYPAIRRFIEETVAKCKNCGYVETIAGRRRYLPNINHTQFAVKSHAERQAVNTTIQGSAADIAKNAMVLVANKIKNKFRNSKNKPKLILQLHDELLYEVPAKYSETLAKILKKYMQDSVKLSIPFPVKIKSGKSWGEMKELII